MTKNLSFLNKAHTRAIFGWSFCCLDIPDEKLDIVVMCVNCRILTTKRVVENNNLIYALVDPRNDLVMYVGKTTIGIGRPLTHLHYSHSQKIRGWVDILRSDGKNPGISVLEEGVDLDILSDREAYWISEYCRINPGMLNSVLVPSLTDLFDFHYTMQDLISASLIIENIGSVVKQTRMASGMTQHDFADIMDLNRSTLSLMENGSNFGVYTLSAILKEAVKYGLLTNRHKKRSSKKR